MNIATIAGHLAFGLIAFSFLVKDILWLRVVSILASLFSVFYNWVIPVEPMWIPIGWNFVFVALNVYHIAVIIYEKRPIKMEPKDKELYETLFKDLSPVEYLKISKVARWETYKSGEKIIKQGAPVLDLILIYNGTVDVAVDNKAVAQCLVWRQPEFKELLKRTPSLYYTIQGLLSNQLISYSNK